eukprot:7378584-Prymnesium_polylepis.1
MAESCASFAVGAFGAAAHGGRRNAAGGLCDEGLCLSVNAFGKWIGSDGLRATDCLRPTNDCLRPVPTDFLR